MGPWYILYFKPLLDLFFFPIHKQFLKLRMVSFFYPASPFPRFMPIFSSFSLLDIFSFFWHFLYFPIFPSLYLKKYKYLLGLAFASISYLSKTLYSIIHGWPAFLCALATALLLTSKLQNKQKTHNKTNTNTNKQKVKLSDSLSQSIDPSQNLLISRHNLFPPRFLLSPKSHPMSLTYIISWSKPHLGQGHPTNSLLSFTDLVFNASYCFLCIFLQSSLVVLVLVYQCCSY